MIRAILFDMGNVLVHFSHERMCRQIGEVVGVNESAVRERLIDSGLFWSYERGELSTDEMVGAVEREFGCPVDRGRLEVAASDIFWRNESMEPLVNELVDLGLPLVLVSNTCDVHIRWVDRHMGVLAHFTRRALSFQLKSAKPDALIFHHAVELAGVAADQCFFTDDTARHVQGALAVGLNAHHFQNANVLRAALHGAGVAIRPVHISTDSHGCTDCH